jgi:transposase
MLRSHLVDSQAVVRLCQRYGVSRQTFYNLQERFLSEGSAGLLAKKPGPKGPSKLTAEVRQFVEHQLRDDAQLRARSLRLQLQEQYELEFHPRTLEKLLSELRSKKNP